MRILFGNRYKSIYHSVIPLTFLLMASTLGGCAKPTEQDCQAALKHAGDIQIDEAKAKWAAMYAAQGMSPDLSAEAADRLKSHIADLVTPAFVAQCVDRMKPADVQCTEEAHSSEELINRCHWKVVPGPRGDTLGF